MSQGANPPQPTPTPDGKESERDQADRALEDGLRSGHRRIKRHGKYLATFLLGGFAGVGKEIGTAVADEFLK